MSSRSTFQSETHPIFKHAITGMVVMALVAGMWAARPTQPAQAAPTELFISEYIEGSSNNKAIEIYNGTLATVDLAAGGYQLLMYFNGSPAAGLTINLTGSVAAGDVYVIAHSSANATILAQADQTNGSGWYNGDDAIALRKGATHIDIIGQIGVDPGAEWGSGLTGTFDNTLRRKSTIHSGDANGSDAFDPSIEWDGYAVDTFDGLGSHSITIVDTPPVVGSTTPANGATDVSINSNLSVVFSEPVTVSGPPDPFTLDCGAGNIGLSYSNTGATYTIDPTGDLPGSATCTATVVASQVIDQDGTPDPMASNYSWTFTTQSTSSCGIGNTPIGSVQGSGAATSYTTPVTVQGVVIGDYEGALPNLQGFYIQDSCDGNASTSDGIFVYNADNNSVALGDNVQVTGTPTEYHGQTEIEDVTGMINCGTGSITPTDVSLPVASADTLERYEGMLVRLPQTLYVTEHYQIGRFGQVLLSSSNRLKQPTNVFLPGSAEATALASANALNNILIDDATNTENPAAVVFGRGGNPLTALNTLRGGDTAANIVGVLTYTWGGDADSPDAYRVRPINALGGGAPNFQAVNIRPSGPASVGGTLQVSAMNLLNYFNTFSGCTLGLGGAVTDCRGADDATEFDRQWPKTVAAILKVNPDVLGLMELENDGYGAGSAIQDLVDKLNNAAGAGTYALIDTDAGSGQVNALGIDAIKVGLIYKPGSVTPVGTTAALNSAAFVNGGDATARNRPALAQAFKQNSNRAVFVITVNHFKSKGSACDDPDAGDGQGNCNIVRTNAANELVDWLATDPTGAGDPDAIIIGDLNAYALEDPITAIKAGGYTDLINQHLGADTYSYAFDGRWGYLDHALGNASLSAQVTGLTEYPINADEPSALDFDTTYKPPEQEALLYAADEFRMSDHDPVIVGLQLLPDDTYADDNGVCGGNLPCYLTPADAIANVIGAGTVHIYPGSYAALNVNKDATVNIEGAVSLTGGLTQSAGTVNLNANRLAMGGDFTRSSGSFNANTGTVAFNGGGLQTITGADTFYNLEINNSGAGIALASALTVNHNLALIDGLLDLGDHNLDLGASAAVSGAPGVNSMVVTPGAGALRKHFSTAGTFTFPVGDNSGATEYSPATLNFTRLSGSGYASVKAINTVHPANNDAPHLLRYWSLGQSGLTDFSCTGTFSYTDADLVTGAGATEADLKAIRYDGTSWRIGGAANAGANTLSMTMTGFSDLTGGSDNPIGVELIAFEAAPLANRIRVHWEVGYTAILSGFNLYRADSLTGGRRLLNAGIMPADPANQGGYTFMDEAALPGQRYYYWLEIVTTEGKSLSAPIQAYAWYALFLPAVRK